MRLVFITFGLFLLFCTKFYAQESDTLVIKFSKDLIDKFIFINKINVYGVGVKKPETTQLTFLFTNPPLKKKLIQKIEKDSIAAIEKKPNQIIIKSYSAGPPQYGIEFNYYQLDTVNLKNYNQQKNYYFRAIDNLEKAGATKKQIKSHKKNLLKTLSPPLKQFYVNEKFLKDKNIFEYTGTMKNYDNLLKKLEKHSTTFILLPFDFSWLYNFKYHLIQVQERYILPGL